MGGNECGLGSPAGLLAGRTGVGRDDIMYIYIEDVGEVDFSLEQLAKQLWDGGTGGSLMFFIQICLEMMRN